MTKSEKVLSVLKDLENRGYLDNLDDRSSVWNIINKLRYCRDIGIKEIYDDNQKPFWYFMKTDMAYIICEDDPIIVSMTPIGGKMIYYKPKGYKNELITVKDVCTDIIKAGYNNLDHSALYIYKNYHITPTVRYKCTDHEGVVTATVFEEEMSFRNAEIIHQYDIGKVRVEISYKKDRGLIKSCYDIKTGFDLS